METLEAPHDTFFRTVFRHAGHAASWLRSLVPTPVALAIEWRALAPVADTSFGIRLRRHHADLVFTATLLTSGAPILIVVEHKAHHDVHLASQVLRYVVHLRRTARHRRSEPEPLVIAVVLRHGPASPRESMHPHLTGLPRSQREAFVALQPQLDFVVDDLTTQNENELLQRAMTPFAQLALLCLRFLPHLQSDDVVAAFDRWAPLLRAIDDDGAPDAIDAVGWYALAVTETRPEQLSHTFARILKRPENTIMSTLERTYQKGKAEGRAETLLRQMARRFGPVPPELVARVQAASPAEFDRLADRVLEAPSLDAVFAD